MGPCAKCGLVHVTKAGGMACAAHRSSDPTKPCARAPINGGTVCTSHFGGAPQVKAKAKRRLAEDAFRTELTMVGVEVEDKHLPEVALEMVRVWRGTERFLRMRVQELDQMMGGPDGNEILAVLGGTGGSDRMEIPAGPPAIAGRIDPRNFKAQPHVLYTMWEHASDRVMHYVAKCRELGIEEARLELDMAYGQQLAAVLQGTVAALLSLVLRLVESGAMSAGEVRQVWAAEVPAIVRGQIMAVRRDEPE